MFSFSKSADETSRPSMEALRASGRRGERSQLGCSDGHPGAGSAPEGGLCRAVQHSPDVVQQRVARRRVCILRPLRASGAGGLCEAGVDEPVLVARAAPLAVALPQRHKLLVSTARHEILHLLPPPGAEHVRIPHTAHVVGQTHSVDGAEEQQRRVEVPLREFEPAAAEKEALDGVHRADGQQVAVAERAEGPQHIVANRSANSQPGWQRVRGLQLLLRRRRVAVQHFVQGQAVGHVLARGCEVLHIAEVAGVPRRHVIPDKHHALAGQLVYHLVVAHHIRGVELKRDSRHPARSGTCRP